MEKELIKGERKCNRITFNPSSAKMGEKVYITLPKLDNNLSILPHTTRLIYNLKISNNKSWPLNNMGKLFVQGLQVKIGRDIVYENTSESIFRIYEDLWKSQAKRKSLAAYGITSVETRKSLGGSSDASSSSTTDGLLDTTIAKLLKNQRIPLGQVLDSHGMHSPAVSHDVKFTLTLPDNSTNVGNKQSSQAMGDFSLENLELEYETIRNTDVVEKNRDALSRGKSYIVQHVSAESITEWAKDATLINENLHISRQSLKALVFLFKYVDQSVDETYIFPNITEVACTVNGRPNMIHNNPMLPDKFESEAKRFFEEKDSEIPTGQFYNNAFSLVLDFRSLGEKNRYGDGIQVDGTSGIQVAFKRTATTKNVRCYTFVISDSIAQVDASGFQKTVI